MDREALRRDCTVDCDSSRQREKQRERRPSPGHKAGPQPFSLLFCQQQSAQREVVEHDSRPAHRREVEDAAWETREYVCELRRQSQQQTRRSEDDMAEKRQQEGHEPRKESENDDELQDGHDEQISEQCRKRHLPEVPGEHRKRRELR